MKHEIMTAEDGIREECLDEIKHECLDAIQKYNFDCGSSQLKDRCWDATTIKQVCKIYGEMLNAMWEEIDKVDDVLYEFKEAVEEHQGKMSDLMLEKRDIYHRKYDEN